MADWMHARARLSSENHRVSTFELLFDLVFVFAFTQLTEFMAVSRSAIGVLQAMMILCLLWWAWASFGWLSNRTHVDEGMFRVAMSIAMGALFVMALAIPQSFDEHPGAMNAGVTLGIGYLVVRVVHFALTLLSASDDRVLRRQIVRTAASSLLTVPLILVGGAIGGTTQTWCWAAAIVAEAIFIYATSFGGNWRVNSASHWSERHGLVIILALGESVVAIGAGAAHHRLSLPIIGGAVLGLAIALALWWLYFDVTAIAAEHLLAKTEGVRRADLARDAYTYIHLLLIAGIVIAALGVEEAIAIADSFARFGIFSAVALFGGTSLYLAAHSLFWRRMAGWWKTLHLAGATILLLLIPVGAIVSAVAALGIAVAILVTIVVLETVIHADRRAEIRGIATPTKPR